MGSLSDNPSFAPGKPDLEKTGAHGTLAGDEGSTAGGARLLAVVVGEDRAFVGDAVNIRRAVPHHAAVIGANVPVADIIAHDDEDVRLLLCLGLQGSWVEHSRNRHDRRRPY